MNSEERRGNDKPYRARLDDVRVLIIEDEPLIAMDLEDIVADTGYSTIAVARTRDEAVRIAADEHPDLILSDIQLADGSSGIDAVGDIRSELAVPVIFMTAFPHKLHTARPVEPCFVIRKPFDSNTVEALMIKALRQGPRRD